MENTNVCNGEHEKHLCMIGPALVTYKQLDELKALVRNAKFICRNCGRVSACAENLCDPEPLK